MNCPPQSMGKSKDGNAEDSKMGVTKTRLLPRHNLNPDAFVTIKPFSTGRMVTPSHTLVEDAQGASMATSWRFLLKHPKTGTDFWFDMGISHDLTQYPPAIRTLHAHFKPQPSPTSLESDTLTSHIPPSTLSHIIISHAHWDHISIPPPSFTSCNMIVGPGTSSHCSPGYPSAPTSKFDGRIWDDKLRTFPLRELPPTSETQVWKRLGPFPSTYDFFSDGSFYLLSMPGHMAGNLAALCRVKLNPEARTKGEEGGRGWKWVLLAGDCAHCNLFTYWPEAPFGKMPRELFPSGCLHEDGEKARESIRWIGDCKKNEGERVLVWYAHGEFLEGLWEL